MIRKAVKMTLKKEDFIAKYGEEAWAKVLEQARERRKRNPEKHKAADKKWRDAHPEKVEENHHEANRKGGKYHARTLEYYRTGLQGERNRIRKKHGKRWRKYKRIIASESQIHHEWVPTTSEYKGVALVEKVPHQYGIIDVIEILDGTITLLTEEEVKAGKK